MIVDDTYTNRFCAQDKKNMTCTLMMWTKNEIKIFSLPINIGIGTCDRNDIQCLTMFINNCENLYHCLIVTIKQNFMISKRIFKEKYEQPHKKMPSNYYLSLSFTRLVH